ncbi:MlaD family protein [uncultured Jannaschia sp.]|uniref:MlaD family protein n=1 Tax=uncultured Jannaschia sp. TaxID=293347 RepID=UPI00261DABD0|nr:MlaD family protein [uncultured Jannaschia sp.]
MEIKANFLLIGLFTLAGIGAVLAAFLWLGAVRIDRDVARYGILFRDVSGLSAAGEVVFNGLPVGRVASLGLHGPDPSLIYVEVEVDAATPIRTDTVAQLTTAGVTGVSYIALIGGTTEAPLLAPGSEGPPLIPSRRAGLQSLMADVPGLVEEAASLVGDLRAMTGPETQAGVARIVANLDGASEKLDATLDGMAGLTEGLGAAATQIAGLGDTIAALEGDVRGTLARADTALIAATEGFDALTPAVADARDVMDGAETLLAEDLPATLRVWRDSGDRLELVLAEAEAGVSSVRRMSDAVGELATGDGAALLASARTALDTAGPALGEELPAALADLRAAAGDARTAIERVSGDVAAATAQLDPLASEARAALSEATSLIARAEPSLDALDAALASADGAFTAASIVIETDIGPAMADLRGAATAIARDLPEVTARADAVLRSIGGAVDTLAPALRTFGTATLPEYGQLARDGRALVRTISDEVRRLSRDPARFIQGGQVPEYRR